MTAKAATPHRRVTIVAALALLCAPLPLYAQAAAPAAVAERAADTAAVPRPAHTAGDPLEGFNRRMFAISTGIDRAFFRPFALGAGEVVPKPVRSGLHNFLRNLTEPIVFLNDLLQLKPKRALATLSRFVINSTVGVAGVLDVAVTSKIKYRNNGFGNTLARYGVGPGPYLFLPLFGPSDLRDFAGGQVDNLVLPTAIGEPFDSLAWQLGTGFASAVDLRISSDEDLDQLMAGAADPYATLRSVYLQSRAAEVRDVIAGDGDAAAGAAGFDDPLADPSTNPAQSPAPRSRKHAARSGLCRPSRAGGRAAG